MNLSPDQVAITLKQLSQYKTTLHKYQQLFEQDKLEATPEQQRMEELLQQIAQIETKLTPSSASPSESMKPEDACDILDQVYPASNVVQYGDSAYLETLRQLLKQMYSNPKCNAVEIYEKIREKKSTLSKQLPRNVFIRIICPISRLADSIKITMTLYA